MRFGFGMRPWATGCSEGEKAGMIDLNYIVATTQIGGYPIPVVGVVDASSNIGLTSIFISDTVALHIPSDDVFLTNKEVGWYFEEHSNHELSRMVEEASADIGVVTDYEFLATLIYCLARKTSTRPELAMAVRTVVKAHRDLVAQVAEINKRRAN